MNVADVVEHIQQDAHLLELLDERLCQGLGKGTVLVILWREINTFYKTTGKTLSPVFEYREVGL